MVLPSDMSLSLFYDNVKDAYGLAISGRVPKVTKTAQVGERKPSGRDLMTSWSPSVIAETLYALALPTVWLCKPLNCLIYYS